MSYMDIFPTAYIQEIKEYTVESTDMISGSDTDYPCLQKFGALSI